MLFLVMTHTVVQAVTHTLVQPVVPFHPHASSQHLFISANFFHFSTWSPIDSCLFSLRSPKVAPMDFDLSPTEFGDPCFHDPGDGWGPETTV